MRPQSIARVINTCLDIQRPAFIWGPPGVGKSEIVAQVAQARGIELRDERLSQKDPVDLRGLPSKGTDGKREVTVWLQPGFLPTRGKGILFLDELVSAPPSVQAAAYQLVLDRALGDYKLPPGWHIIAAGNRAGDRSVVHTMPSALANRFLHLDLEINNDDWLHWAETHGMCPEVLGFIRFRPSALYSFDPKVNPRAYPTPRSWSFVNQIVEGHTLPQDDLFELLKGTIGEGAGGEFMAFLNVVRDLPTFEQIVKDPLKIPVPTGLDVLYAITAMMAPRTDKTNAEAVMKFVMRIPIEFQVVYLRSLWLRDNSFTSMACMRKWITENGSVMLT